MPTRLLLRIVLMFLGLGILLAQAAPERASLVIEAAQAELRTEGGPLAGGGWNLWSQGHVGQPVRLAAAGSYQIVIRAKGSPAGGIWPQMALLVDGGNQKTISVDSAQWTDYRFDVDLEAGNHEIAAGFLNDALIGQEDRNLYLERFTVRAPAGVAAPMRAERRDLAQAEVQREQKLLAATEAAIAKNRKSDATLKLVDASGKPVAGTKLTVNQVSHAFPFGCNIYMFDRFGQAAQNEAYKKRFAELFNYATVAFYWKGYETARGKPHYAYTDKVVAWCQEQNIRMKGHPLLWGDAAGIPAWSQGLPSEELQQQRVRDILARYQGKITFWEVVNEPSHQPLPKIDQPYRWARQADPKGCLIVNDYAVLSTGAPDFLKLLQKAQANGVPFDAIGIQAHEPRTMRFPLDRVKATLDTYAALGKPLHITEFTPASGGEKFTGTYRQGTWDEKAQAEYAVAFYRVCFAHPAVQAITWWDLCDRGAWLKGGGLLREDLSPKPAFEQLRKLIHEEWTTHVTGTTDAEGRLKFRGFRGRYRITGETAGGKIDQQVELNQDGELVVHVGAAVGAGTP